MRIGIVGAGIAGLSLAVRLRDSEHEVVVLERAPEILEVGAGIQLAPNAVRRMQAMGLAEDLAAIGVATTRIESRDGSTGALKTTADFVRDDAFVYGVPHYQCHRAAFQRLLADRLAPGVVRTGVAVADLTDEAGMVQVRSEAGESWAFDLLVGADGIRSTVRRAAFPQDPATPRFAGAVAFRGTLTADQARGLELQDEAVKWWGSTPEHHFVAYRLGDDRVNFIGMVPRPTWDAEGWSEPGDPEELRAAFADFEPHARAVLDRVTETFRWGLFDIDLAHQWTKDGQLVLIGDACHAMPPFMGQGAAQGIEDAALLGDLVEKLPTPDRLGEALAEYESVRRPRVERVHEGSRRGTHLSSQESLDWLYGAS